MTDKQRTALFWSRVQKPPKGRRKKDCWIWIGSKNHAGYGQMFWQSVTKTAHRISYELSVGPIPEGMQLDHLCVNPPCVNPHHLEPVTARVNNSRRDYYPGAFNAAKTFCKRGHEFTPENTYMPPGRAKRHCRECQRFLHRRAAAKKRVSTD